MISLFFNRSVTCLLSAVSVFLAFFLHACAPGYLLIPEAEMDDFNAHLAEIRAEMDEQAETMEDLRAAYELGRLQAMQDALESRQAKETLTGLIREKHDEVLLELSKAAPEPEADAAPIAPLAPELSRMDKLVVGQIEKVMLTPPKRLFHARMDTGATTSSLDARDIETFERDGSAWVRFTVVDPENGDSHVLEKPVVRHVRIYQSSNAEGDRRPVVKLQLQLGRIQRVDEFTLVDREHLDYQVLIGRNILTDLMVVDVADKFIVDPPEYEENGNDR